MLTLLPAELFRQLPVGDIEDIATVNVTVQCGSADRPLTVFLFHVYNSVYGHAEGDLLCHVLCVGVVIAELDIRAAGGSLKVCVRAGRKIPA